MTLSVPNFSSAGVLVVGDVMLDRYWFGPTQRISPEAPVPVVRISDTEERPGGAANVAVILGSLGVRTTLLGLTGEDEPASRLEELLRARGIDCGFARVAGVPTVTKLRILSHNQQLIRLDFEEPPAPASAAALQSDLRARLPGHDVVILSDYAKGALEGAPDLIAACREAAVPVLVDPKGTDFERYRGATGLTPNLAEFQAVVGSCDEDSSLVRRGEELRRGLGLEYLLVTRGERGMTLITADGHVHLPAEAREVFDVTGAGDTVIALFGAGLAAGETVEQAAGLANLAAGLVVRKLGVATVTPAELRLALHQRGKGGRGLITAEQLVEFVRESQARGERVIMTNGCFDILHAGHVGYLEEAKSLGDRLVVAVNDDGSVRRLKGKGRPINPLADRMAVLAGLAAVDWVVPFAQDTPESLISKVLPDVLVKGGDYRPEDIVGGECVRRNGGEVIVLAFRQGRSTTSTIEALRRLS